MIFKEFLHNGSDCHLLLYDVRLTSEYFPRLCVHHTWREEKIYVDYIAGEDSDRDSKVV